jgi:DNA topoisomerase-1
VSCPKPGCGGFLTEKRTKRGKPFYGCSNYAKTGCDFVSWDRPVKEPCPECGAEFLLQKETRRGPKLRCATCKYTSDAGEDMPEVEEGAA